MIEFKIVIRQLENGRMSFRCDTPAGRATLDEQGTARELMNVIRDFTCAHGRTVIVHDWKDPNNPKKN